MSFPFVCPTCGRSYELTQKHVGRRVRCVGCNKEVRFYPQAVAPPPLPDRSAAPAPRVNRGARPRRDERSVAISSPTSFRVVYWFAAVFVIISPLASVVGSVCLYKLYSVDSEINNLRETENRELSSLGPKPEFREPREGWRGEDFLDAERAYDRESAAYGKKYGPMKDEHIKRRESLDKRFDNYVLVLVLVTLLNAMAFFAAVPFVLACVYKMWALIQDGHARTSPAAGAFCLLIPFYHIYWGCVALHGWTIDVNRYIQRHGHDVEPVSGALSITSYVAFVMRWIPGINLVFELPLALIFLRWLYVATSTAAEIAEERLAAQPPTQAALP